MSIHKQNKIKVCGVIPARYGSTRFPGKALAMLAGKPIIQHVYERCSEAQYLDTVVVATDDRRIADVVEGFGGIAVMTSRDHQSGTDRIAEVVQGIDCEAVVNIQGDEPLINSAVIDRIAEELINDSQVEMVTPITETTDPEEIQNPNIVKVVIDVNGYALYFSRFPIPFIRDEQPGKWYKHIGLYGYRKEFLLRFVSYKPSFLENAERLEQLRVLENGHKIKTVVTAYQSIGVDTPADLMEVEKRI